MNSKAKGELSEIKVIARLLELGHSVSLPFGNNQRYDLILDDGKHLWKCQVKTGRYENGCVVFSACSTNGFTRKKKDYREDIDFFLVYCPVNEGFYKVPVEQASKTETSLRVEEPVKYKSDMRWARDFEL